MEKDDYMTMRDNWRLDSEIFQPLNDKYISNHNLIRLRPPPKIKLGTNSGSKDRYVQRTMSIRSNVNHDSGSSHKN